MKLYKQKTISNRYKILRKLGAGAMGEVFQARDLKNNQIVALKILSREKTSSETVQHFKREFKLLTELQHPNLCEVYDFGMLKDGQGYFTMDYVDGKNIFEATKDLPRERIYSLIVQICRTLEYIHSKGLIHYDIKPNNILVQKPGDDPVVKLMDFGLAGEQMVKGGTLIKGTLPYIAPEVIKGLAVDHRADLYSLGVLFYEIYARRPFGHQNRKSFVTLLTQGKDWIAEPLSKIVADIPKGLERLISKLLAQEPAERFSRANEVIREINKISGLKFGIETGQTLEGYLLSSKFVGRTREMDSLRAFYEKTKHGDGKVVIITGEPGIGKSRLLKEFKIFAQLERSYCFTGNAYRDKTKALEPFHEIFRELMNYVGDGKQVRTAIAVLSKIFPDLVTGQLTKNLPDLVPLDAQQEKLRNFEALSELVLDITSKLGQLVILFEDLHWADDLSIQFLGYLGRNLSGQNILICTTTQQEPLTQNKAFKRLIDDLKNEGCLAQITLNRLNFRNLYAFLDSTITPGSNSMGLAKYLMKKTGGNPFFVEEIMRVLLQKKGVIIGERLPIEQFEKLSIPGTIGDIVSKRLKDLDHDSQHVIKYGAILLKDFNYDLMKRLTGFNDIKLSRALWELKRRQVLIEENSKYRFYHATLRDAMNRRFGEKERTHLHYRVGKVLENLCHGKFDRVIEDLAFHFISARHQRKGVVYGLRAAKKCSERYAYEQAIEFYNGVLALLNQRKAKLCFDILPKMAYFEMLAGRYKDAAKHYNQALKQRAGSTAKRIDVYLGLGGLYDTTGDTHKALCSYQKGLDLLKKMPSSQTRVLLKVNIDVKICRNYLMMGDYQNATAFNLDALRFSKGLRGKEAIKLQAKIYNTMGTIEYEKGEYSKTDYNEAISYFEKALRYYKKIEIENGTAIALTNLGLCYNNKCDYHKALMYYEKAVKLAKKIGIQAIVAAGLCNFGRALGEIGDSARALDFVQNALVVAKRIGNPSIIGYVLLELGICFFRLCDYAKAQECYEKALNLFDTLGWKMRKPYPIIEVGKVHQVKGEYSFSLRFYREALRISQAIGNQFGVAASLIDISSTYIALGEIAKATKHINDALKITSVLERKDIANVCFMILCRINIMMHNHTAVYDFYKKGVEIARRFAMKYQLLQFLILLSEICYYDKKSGKGIKAANKAIRLAEKMGAKDLCAEALTIKAKIAIDNGILSRIELTKILDEAKQIAEEIACPEILWKVNFEYARFLQNDKQYFKALEYYQKCHEIFKKVGSKIKNKRYRQSYLSRPDRQAVFTAIDEIEKITRS